MEETFISETPKKDNKKIIIGVVVVASAILVIGAIAFVFMKKEEGNSLMISESLQNKIAIDENLLQILAQGSNLTFPKLISSTPASLEILPESLRGFIFPSPQETKVERVIFGDGAVGFSLDYKINMNFTDTYRAFVTQKFSGWDKIYGARNDTLGLIYFQTEAYKVKIIVGINGSDTSVNLISVGK